MPGFSLLTLTPIHLEKVINKLREKSYYRLQQTCRDATEFIRKSPYISVYADEYDLTFDNESSSWCCSLWSSTRTIQIKALYGTRLERLRIIGEKKGTAFENLCVSLKRNRITCNKLVMKYSDWNAEECATFSSIVKPVSVDLNSWGGSDRVESLFLCKTLKSAEVKLSSDSCVPTVVEKLLSSFEEVIVSVFWIHCNSSTFTLFRSILQMFLSKPHSKLRGFEFNVYNLENMPSADEIEKMLREDLKGQLSDLEVMLEEEESVYMTITVGLPSHFPNGSYCYLVVSDYCSIEYSSG